MKRYITITGTKHYYGKEIFYPGMKVKLVKDYKNEYDKDAIAVKIKGLGTVGYVANTPYTTIGQTMSASRIYEHLEKKAHGKVIHCTPLGIIVKIKKSEYKK